jgi:hypothetical protein
MDSINRKHWKRIRNKDGVLSLLVPAALSEDYDGCFGNTDEAMRIVENIVEERTYLTVDDIRDARATVESSMQPFSTVDYIQKELIDEGTGMTWEDDIRPFVMERAMRTHHRERLLARGAKAVFAVAAELGMPEVVVTHGAVAPPYGPKEEWAAVEWQTTKVKMTPELQDKPLVVTYISSKSTEFRTWYDHEMKAFLLPKEAWYKPNEPVYARNVLHVDDKRSALKNWPSDIPLHAIHYLPERDEDVRQTQLKGRLPDGVPVARGMGRVAEILVEFYERVA